MQFWRTLQDELNSATEAQLPVVSTRPGGSRPIAIKSAMSALEDSQDRIRKNVLTTVFEPSTKDRNISEKVDVLQAASLTKQAGPKIDLAASATPVGPPKLSPTSALAPWLTILNPSNPRTMPISLSDKFRRWQHVFPRLLPASSFKWKSLCSPAALPLTTEYFPTADQLQNEYQESPYLISQNEDEDLNEQPRSGGELIRELVALRLAQGFQIVVGAAVAEATGKASLKVAEVFDKNYLVSPGAMLFMSMGNHLHQLICGEENNVEVRRFVRKPAASATTQEGPFTSTDSMRYDPQIRTVLSNVYEHRTIVFRPPMLEYNWNYVDQYIAGYEESITDQFRLSCARFVLIPVEPPKKPPSTLAEDNDEEIRIEGIRKLTQLFQRHRYVPPEESRFSAFGPQRENPNPLDIVYKTLDPSLVIAAELDGLPLDEAEPNPRRSQLFNNSEHFEKSNLNLSKLAQEIQGEKGVKLQDRRWHLRLHYNCFIGSEFTTWMLDNFKDIETREEAQEFGNELMKSGLFQHVERRHRFRDGNFFYQITSEYSRARPQSKGGWFGSRRADKSVPSTPLSESKESPIQDRSRSSSSADEESVDSGTRTPTSARRLKVALSKVMKYDVDHRKKSYRPELIDLHYELIHNPDNCYHIRVDWINVTAKLIEDTLVSWATTADRYGLKLVEVPIDEISSIVDSQPLRSPGIVKLPIAVPESQPQQYFDAGSLGPQSRPDHHFYHKAILKKFGFVLDMEAARNFPSDVDVTYSWGKPKYRFSQYIHRSGVLLIQITERDEFLLLANHLYSNRVVAARDSNKFDRHDGQISRGFGVSSIPVSKMNQGFDGASAHASPIVNPELDVGGVGTSNSTLKRIRSELEAFCADEEGLRNFFELAKKSASPVPNTPISVATGNALSPTTGLGRGSPSPFLGMSNVGANVPPVPSDMQSLPSRRGLQADTSLSD